MEGKVPLVLGTIPLIQSGAAPGSVPASGTVPYSDNTPLAPIQQQHQPIPNAPPIQPAPPAANGTQGWNLNALYPTVREY